MIYKWTISGVRERERSIASENRLNWSVGPFLRVYLFFAILSFQSMNGNCSLCISAGPSPIHLTACNSWEKWFVSHSFVFIIIHVYLLIFVSSLYINISAAAFGFPNFLFYRIHRPHWILILFHLCCFSFNITCTKLNHNVNHIKKTLYIAFKWKLRGRIETKKNKSTMRQRQRQREIVGHWIAFMMRNGWIWLQFSKETAFFRIYNIHTHSHQQKQQ